MNTRHRCTECNAESVYQVFSGGREWHCPNCHSSGEYRHDEAPRRAALLQTEDGRTALRAEMDQELARQRDED